MTVLLSVQGLTKAYGPRPLFSDLCLDLRAGERVGLIGPNGSGKSTLLRLLAGREEPDAGVRSARRGARLGYLAQDDVFAAGLHSSASSSGRTWVGSPSVHRASANVCRQSDDSHALGGCSIYGGSRRHRA